MHNIYRYNFIHFKDNNIQCSQPLFQMKLLPLQRQMSPCHPSLCLPSNDQDIWIQQQLDPSTSFYHRVLLLFFSVAYSEFSRQVHPRSRGAFSNILPNGHMVVDLPSIRRRNSTWKSRWKLWHQFDVEISTWIWLSKSTKYRWVLHMDFLMLFRSRIDVISVPAVSIVLFPSIFCSGNLF